ncbi:MAG TPA: hypothetical protein PLG90_04365 [Ignavibacteria bacterium]|nr:hypothetical protein [Ignavibacteria bacterium]
MKTIIKIIILTLILKTQDLFAQTESASSVMDMKVYTEWMLGIIFLMFFIIFANLIFSKDDAKSFSEFGIIQPQNLFTGNAFNFSAGFSIDLNYLVYMLISTLLLFVSILTLLII